MKQTTEDLTQNLERTIQSLIDISSPQQLAELQETLIQHSNKIERLLWAKYRRNAA